MKQDFFKNTKYEIFGKNGWEDFDGVVVTYNDNIKILHIITDKHKWIKCTSNHKLYDINDVEIESQYLKINDYIQTIDGLEKITKIDILYVDTVYDIVNSDSHQIFTNGIKNHQCDEFAFVPKNQCLIGDTSFVEIEKDGIIQQISLEDLYKMIGEDNKCLKDILIRKLNYS